MSNTSDALTYIAEGAAVGAGIGVIGSAFENNPVIPSIANGALAGTGAVTLGSLVVAALSEKNREKALETAGLGFGAFVLVAIGRAVSKAAA